MNLFDINTIKRDQWVYVHVPYDGIKPIRVRELYIKDKNKPTMRLIGFNSGGNSFNLDGLCREAPWIRASLTKDS